MDTTAHALDLLAANRYMVLATADEDGTPWATPVWFAPDGLDRILWLSWPGSRHSRLIARRPQVALTVFDSSRPSEDAAAFYAVASAAECPEPSLDAALAHYNRRTQEHGLPAFRREERHRAGPAAALRRRDQRGLGARPGFTRGRAHSRSR